MLSCFAWCTPSTWQPKTIALIRFATGSSSRSSSLFTSNVSIHHRTKLASTTTSLDLHTSTNGRVRTIRGSSPVLNCMPVVLYDLHFVSHDSRILDMGFARFFIQHGRFGGKFRGHLMRCFPEVFALQAVGVFKTSGAHVWLVDVPRRIRSSAIWHRACNKMTPDPISVPSCDFTNFLSQISVITIMQSALGRQPHIAA